MSDVSRETPKPERAAPSDKNKRSSVYIYLLILFGAAFLMLLLAYFVQQRNSETTISDLRDSMNLSRAELLEQVETLEREKGDLEKAVASLSPAVDELEALKVEYAKLEEQLQAGSELLSEYQRRHRILESFAILEQALRDKEYEVAARKAQALVQENLDLGIVNLDGSEYFDAKARLTEVISLLEKRGVLEPGELDVP